MRRTKFEQALANYVDEHYLELEPIDATKAVQKASIKERCEVYALLILIGLSWTKIAEWTGQDRSTLWRFRMKHGRELATEVEDRAKLDIGVETFWKSLVALMRAGNIEALKLFAIVTGRVTQKVQVEGKIAFLQLIKNAGDHGGTS